MRLSQVGSPDILEKFDATFESYWESPEYESYEPARDAASIRSRGGAASKATRSRRRSSSSTSSRGRTSARCSRSSPPSANGITASRTLSWPPPAPARRSSPRWTTSACAIEHGDLRLLFVAHRQEILKQSLGAFRQVLRSGDFGELYVDGHRPDEWRHVFASVQSLAQVDFEQLDPDAFDVVIVDEFHHAAAPTYRRLLEHLFEGDRPTRSTAAQNPPGADRHARTHRRRGHPPLLRRPHRGGNAALGRARARAALPVPVFRAARQHRPVVGPVVAQGLRRRRARAALHGQTTRGCDWSWSRCGRSTAMRGRCARWDSA